VPALLAAAFVWDAWHSLQPDQHGLWKSWLLASLTVKERKSFGQGLLPRAWGAMHADVLGPAVCGQSARRAVSGGGGGLRSHRAGDCPTDACPRADGAADGGQEEDVEGAAAEGTIVAEAARVGADDPEGAEGVVGGCQLPS
jgi:hypothetical protein